MVLPGFLMFPFYFTPFFFLSDRPSPPRDIVVSDIKAVSCYLTWSAPDDDGGSEIMNYIIERRDAIKKKSDWEQLTCVIVDRRYGVSFSQIFYQCFYFMSYQL